MKLTIPKSLTALVLTAGLAITSIFPCAPPAAASSKGRLNTALILGGLSIYEGLTHKNKTPAILGAVGTFYAYQRYLQAKKRERVASYYRGRYGAASYYPSRAPRYYNTYNNYGYGSGRRTTSSRRHYSTRHRSRRCR